MSVWSHIVEAYQKLVTPPPPPEEPPKPVKNPDTKVCKKCGIEKPRSAFYERKAHSPNAISSACRECTSAYNAEVYRKRKKEKTK